MKIKNILFDLGGTLEDNLYSDTVQEECILVMQKLLLCFSDSFNIDSSSFCKIVRENYKKYRKWSIENEQELSSYEIWANFVFLDFKDDKKIFILVSDILSSIWECKFCLRSLKPSSIKILKKLKKDGYHLGLISNAISNTMPLKYLDYYGISSFFECVVLSSEVKRRKPNIQIFNKALNLMQINPNETLYVGDQADKDAKGAKRANINLAVVIKSSLTVKCSDDIFVDYFINDLDELLEIVDANKNSPEGV